MDGTPVRPSCRVASYKRMIGSFFAYGCLMHPRLQDRHPSSGMTHCSHTNAPHVPHSRTQWVHTPSPHPSHVCQHSSHTHMPHVRHWWSAPGNGLAFQQSRFLHSNRIWRFATSRISCATSQRRESSFTSVPYVASNQSDNESGTSDSQRSIWTAISARPSAFFSNPSQRERKRRR